MNLIEEIARRSDPDAIALIEGEREITYAQLFTEARDIAAKLREELPAARHPRIGLDCPNGADYIVYSMALLLAGACLVPMAEELSPDEREEITHTTALDFILSVDTGSASSAESTFSLTQLSPKQPSFPEDAFQQLNPAFIRFSSGTTGTSKGVVLSHETILARVTAANRGLQIGPSDRILWMLPMAHHFAVSIVLYLHAGATTILEPSPLAADVLATAERHQATLVYGAPFHYALMAADPGPFHWPSLRLAVSTAAALPEETARHFEQRFHKPLVQGLGIIEVGLAILNLHAAAQNPTALGKPLPDYEVRLLDDQGNEVPDHAAGEFHVRGPGLLDAYLVPWNPEPLIDGFFASGDLVQRDAKGLLTLVGRKKSVINVGGMKVFPEEIEAVLDRHPSIERSRVVGRDHPHTGQVPVAEFIPHDFENPPKGIDLQRYCREHLSPYKVPLRYTPLPELPLTPSGKLRRT